MVALGWITLTLGGAWLVFIAALWLVTVGNEGKGIGPLIYGFYAGVASAAIWVAVVAWLSPLTMGWAQ